MHDLKTLNVSRNNVVIDDSVSAKQWEIFLRSFSGSMKLRRLDLSGNKLGAKAFEVFARVYELEDHITPLRLGGDTSVLSYEEDARQHRENKQYAIEITQKGNRASAAERSMADGCLLKRRCGLRSLPYIDLNDTGLDDAGALWLSFVLPQHYFPIQLVDGINGVFATSTINIYQQTQNSTGLEWSNNEETLGRDGFQLLTYVETLRKETLYENANRSNADLNDDDDGIQFDPAISSQTALVPRASITNLREAIAPRKLSGRFVPNLSEAELNAASLSQTRHRLQRQIIQQQGVHSIDLWSSAIDLVVLSRRLFVLERYLSAASVQRRACRRLIKDITNAQKPSRKQQWRHLQKNDTFKFERLQDEITKLGAASRAQYFNYQVERSREHSAREYSLVGVIPFSIFKQILRHIMSEDELSVLNEPQQRAAYAFCQTRATLTLEREWTKLNDSAQVLKLLDHIGCLAYEGRS
ncbi:hypothetical protein AMS68_004668 [Peltaster fructicola]|uniref:Uncharacterized protein n=1 Tax=Peltaster fructicola TaxID=286661 RepID=A0A6H0XWW4_9PEZI|nr:hypothetical protein AMS68_004668 [Peltaster fructicola]